MMYRPPHLRSAAGRLCHSCIAPSPSFGGRSSAPFQYASSMHGHSPFLYRPLTFVRRQVDCAIPICIFDAWAQSLPIQVFGGYFIFVYIVVSYCTITKLDNTVCHILDGVIMCNHYNGIAIFLIYIFNKLEDLL